MLRSAVSCIRAKVNEVYRNLYRLCDVLDEKPQASHDPNPHELMISESKELLDGLKKLFAESDADEQFRLMTIAPKEWGQQKIEKWCIFYPHSFQSLAISSIIYHWRLLSFVRFQSKQNQARRSLVLRKNKGMLAYLQCLREDIPLFDATIDAVIRVAKPPDLTRSLLIFKIFSC
jgi:hypothetical protein